MPSDSTIYKLPREILDQIIAHLLRNQNQADIIAAKKTIAACSLASWIFVPSCRHAMFAANPITGSVFTKVGCEEEEMEKLIDLINSPVQTIGMALRRVRFVAMSKRKAGVRRERVPEITQRTGEVLRNIESIHLESSSPKPNGVESGFWKLIDMLRGVRDVRIGARELMGNTRLLKWVCELPELEVLSIVSATVRPEQQKSRFREEDRMQFQKLADADKVTVMLEIGGPEELTIIRWLLAQIPVPRIRSVRVRSTVRGCWDDRRHDDGPQLVKQFFQVCGSSIRHLCVVVPREGGFGDALEVMNLDHCDDLDSIRIEGIQVGPECAAGKEQQRALEMLLEQMFAKPSIGPQVNRVTLTIQVDPQSRGAFAFFGISDVSLFKNFEWGKVPEILERAWLGPRGRASRYQDHSHATLRSGDKWSYQTAFAHRSQEEIDIPRKKLVMIIQGGSKHGRDRLVDILRRGAFRVFDERALFSVHFDAEGTQPRGCYF